jgi:type I restriction enzyme M protein
MRGGIPERDLDDPLSPLAAYWQVLPGVRSGFFESAGHAGYVRLTLPAPELKPAILGHAEFTAFNQAATRRFTDWRAAVTPRLTAFGPGDHPKLLIETITEELLAAFDQAPLLDAYDLYQHLMDFAAETMQDDAYLIALEGWVAKTSRILETDKKCKTKDRGWTCDLTPKPLIVARYFAKEQAAIESRQAELDAASASQAELEEEQGDDDGVFAGFDDGINASTVKSRIREIGTVPDDPNELKILQQWFDLGTQISALKKKVKDADAALDKLAFDKYPKLTEADVKSLVVDDKWMARLAASVQGELDRVSQTLTGRIRELAERYATLLPQLTDEVAVLAARVAQHIERMGATWS